MLEKVFKINVAYTHKHQAIKLMTHGDGTHDMPDITIYTYAYPHKPGHTGRLNK